MALNKNESIPEKGGNSLQSGTFRIVEAYKTIRTNLLFTLSTSDKRVVIFSSAEPSAGKSTLTSNLSVVMAQTGARVLLIDADMRKPVQHRSFRVSKSLGLSKILGGLNTMEECLCKNVSPNLDLIPSGSIPPNPSELLGSARMTAMLKELEKQYDYIFVDTPPLSVVSDALVLAPQSAGLVLVARQKQTTYEELREAVDNVEQIKANLLGVVVTDVRGDKSAYGHYERNKYYKAYNYEYSGRNG